MEPAEAIRPLPPEYHQLYQRVVEICEPDTRIRGLWLSGSLARGTADAASDLDLLLAVEDQSYEEFVAGSREWLAGITPTLLVKEIPNKKLIFTSLTDQLCRLDVVAEPVSTLVESPFRTRVVVFDRDGLDHRVPEPEQRPGPDPAKITAMIEEFWRIQSIFPVMVDRRRDLLCAQSGVHVSIQMLYDLFVESNQPQPLMGVKHYAARLTAEQRAALESVPAVGLDRDSLITADLAVTEAMDTAGRAAAQRAGATYPEVLADAVRAGLRDRFTDAAVSRSDH
jgi:hypothetical protein